MRIIEAYSNTVPRRKVHFGRTLATALLATMSFAAHADLLVSSNDGHTAMVNGKLVQAQPTVPDTLTFMEVGKGGAPRLLNTLKVPGSVVGPPMSVWLSPDESWGVVTASTAPDAAKPGNIRPNDEVFVFETGGSPAGSKADVVQQLTAGPGAASVRVSPDDRYAVIANRDGGTVSFFEIHGHVLRPLYTYNFGKASGPNGAVFLHDSKTVLVTVNAQNRVAILRLSDTGVTEDPRSITTGLAPLTIDVTADGKYAAVSNMGRNNGDVDTVSLIDLTTPPYRVVDIAAVPSGPEPLKFSPDGRYLAIGSENGTTKAASSPFAHTSGYLSVFQVKDGHLALRARAGSGGWLEGIAFSKDGRNIYLQDMNKNVLWVYGWNGSELTVVGEVPSATGPSAFATAWP